MARRAFATLLLNFRARARGRITCTNTNAQLQMGVLLLVAIANLMISYQCMMKVRTEFYAFYEACRHRGPVKDTMKFYSKLYTANGHGKIFLQVGSKVKRGTKVSLSLSYISCHISIKTHCTLRRLSMFFLLIWIGIICTPLTASTVIHVLCPDLDHGMRRAESYRRRSIPIW